MLAKGMLKKELQDALKASYLQISKLEKQVEEVQIENRTLTAAARNADTTHDRTEVIRLGCAVGSVASIRRRKALRTALGKEFIDALPASWDWLKEDTGKMA